MILHEVGNLKINENGELSFRVNWPLKLFIISVQQQQSFSVAKSYFTSSIYIEQCFILYFISLLPTTVRIYPTRYSWYCPWNVSLNINHITQPIYIDHYLEIEKTLPLLQKVCDYTPHQYFCWGEQFSARSAPHSLFVCTKIWSICRTRNYQKQAKTKK